MRTWAKNEDVKNGEKKGQFANGVCPCNTYSNTWACRSTYPVVVEQELNVLLFGLHELLPHGGVHGASLHPEGAVPNVDGGAAGVQGDVLGVVVLLRVGAALADLVVVAAAHGAEEHVELRVPDLRGEETTSSTYDIPTSPFFS